MKYARGVDDRITNLFKVIQGVTGGLLYWTLISGVSTSNLKTIRHNFINHWNSPYPPFINPQFQCIWRIVTSKSSKCLIKKSTILCVLVIKDKRSWWFWLPENSSRKGQNWAAQCDGWETYTRGKLYFEQSAVKGASLNICILNCWNSLSVQRLKEYCWCFHFHLS